MKRKNREDEQDRLTSLPDSLLLHILGFIDTKSAIQLCLLLSKTFERNLWNFLPSLTFDSSLFQNLQSFRKFVARVLKELGKNSFDVNRINFIRSCRSADYTLLEKVTKFAVSHGVQHLNITINDEVNSSCFLQPLYASKSIRTLTLCTSESLDHPLRLDRLTSLHLRYVVLGESDIFSGCPNLNVLKLHSCKLGYNVPALNVFAPRLSKLIISYCGYTKCEFRVVLRTPGLEFLRIVHSGPLLLQTIELPLLHTVEVHRFLTYWRWEKDELCLKTINMLRCFHNAKFVTLSAAIFKLLSECPELLATEASPFDQLHRLSIATQSYKHSDIDEHVATYLVKNSPRVKIVERPPRNYHTPMIDEDGWFYHVLKQSV